MNELNTQLSFTLFSTLLLAGAVLGIFLAMLLLTIKHGHRHANSLLAILLILFVLDLLGEFAMQTGFIYRNAKLASLYWALDLWFGPLTYLYTRSLTDQVALQPPQRALSHLILPVTGLIGAISVSFLCSDAQFRDTLVGQGPLALQITEAALILAGIISMVTYIIWSLLALKNHSARAADQFSYRERVCLTWLRNLLGALVVLVILYLLVGLLADSAVLMNRIFFLAIVGVIFGIGFMGIRQPLIFIQKPSSADELKGGAGDTDCAKPTKYEKSALSEIESKTVFDETTKLLEKRKLYKENDLSLTTLADELGLPSHYVSQAINQASGSNFFDLINGHRVRYLKGVFSDHSSRSSKTILQHALDAGFNSKSAFYTAFKKHTGRSPRQFMDSVA